MYNGAFILGLAAKATVIFTAGAALTLALRHSAAARYLTWISVFAAILALPLLSLLSWSIPVQAPSPIAAPTAVHLTLSATPAVTAQAFPWARSLTLVWLGGFAFLLFRIATGHLTARAMLRRSQRVTNAGWLKSLDDVASEITSRATLLQSDETDVPLSYGFVRPAIVLGGNFESWTADRRRAVLIHELTHVRRRDTLLTLMAQLATAVYWPHPLAWFALARFRKEQECSCDDAVLQAGVHEADYADHLVSVARTFERWPVAHAMARTNHLEERVRALLDPSKRRLALTPRMCAITMRRT